MTKVDINEWEAARVTFYNVLNFWDSQDPHVQAQMRHMMDVIKNNLEVIEKQERSKERLKQAERQATARERKKLRDEMIPAWCEENLKPGMVVKVKANSSTKFREIESVKPGSTMANGYKFDGYLTGRHVRYVRRRNPETLEFAHELTRDGYITDHVLRNVQAVVTGVDATGKPILTPIMELIEGA